MPETTWSTTVRFVEVDAQDVVFNAHYLTWCDEAMNRLFEQLGRVDVAVAVRLVTTTLTWRSSARWRDPVDVVARVVRVGTSSLTMGFEVRVGERVCCTAETVYAHVGASGTAEPLADDVRALLTG